MIHLLDSTVTHQLNLMKLKGESFGTYDFKNVENFFISYDDISMISDIRRISENYRNDSPDNELFRGSYYIMNEYYVDLIANAIESRNYVLQDIPIEETARAWHREAQLRELENLKYEKAEGQLAVYRKVEEEQVQIPQVFIFVGLAAFIIGGLALFGKK